MPLLTTRAIILQTHRYSETSKILRLMTREYGPRSAIARGALRPKSRFGGVLESFAEGTATLFVKENRELDSLSAFDLVRERQALGTDLDRFNGAAVLCEVVLRLAPGHRDLLLYRALVEGLDRLLTAPRGEVATTALRHIWQLVRLLGFSPHLDACIVCGHDIVTGMAASFDFPGGGLRCRSCPEGGRFLSATDISTLKQLVNGVEGPMDPQGGQGSLLADFIRYHMAEGTRLRSLPFLSKLG